MMMMMITITLINLHGNEDVLNSGLFVQKVSFRGTSLDCCNSKQVITPNSEFGILIQRSSLLSDQIISVFKKLVIERIYEIFLYARSDEE